MYHKLMSSSTTNSVQLLHQNTKTFPDGTTTFHHSRTNSLPSVVVHSLHPFTVQLKAQPLQLLLLLLHQLLRRLTMMKLTSSVQMKKKTQKLSVSRQRELLLTTKRSQRSQRLYKNLLLHSMLSHGTTKLT